MSSSIHEVLTGGPVAGTIARRPATQLDRWWRTLFGFPVMLGVLLVGAVYVFANRSIADPDIWWHLRNAEFLVQHGSMIRHDMYSFTASGAPWINHEWLRTSLINV
jgi:asparagine N-glycosylation enzyme membrane subunit Stt3